ncbi:MAG: ferrous iron transport protein A [Lachnospiraceae bacterium]|nr:ferrous iron transport protein A [Lachnospiraceae bacterium]
MPIAMIDSGAEVKVLRINGSDEVRQHLSELGFVADSEVRVVSNTNGNVIVMVKGSRVALDKSMAMRVIVG